MKVIKKSNLQVFKVYYNNYNKTATCSIVNGKSWTECIPKDIWDDFLNAMDKKLLIEQTLLYKRIDPTTPADKRKEWNFSFYIQGEGLVPHYISKVQEVPFEKRLPSNEERLFRDWFLHLCNEKLKITKRSR